MPSSFRVGAAIVVISIIAAFASCKTIDGGSALKSDSVSGTESSDDDIDAILGVLF